MQYNSSEMRVSFTQDSYTESQFTKKINVIVPLTVSQSLNERYKKIVN